MDNKLKMESVDITEQNIERIAELFPQVVTEVADPSGAKNDDGTPRLRKAIDFEKLKLVLSAGTGDYVVADDDRERYEFTWVGKRQSMIDAAKPIRKTLRPCPQESKNWDSTENLYIEGDNLEVLKLLQESYLGKVKMIYIDPPYNTGNDFVYRDKWSVDSEQWAVDRGQYDEDENRLFQNTETNGRFHSDWCSMIYPRLQLARNLLTDDGVIFISIDDNEVENLKKIGNEVFGDDNFVACFKWNRVAKAPSLSGAIRTKYEYVIVYSKDISPKLFGKESYNKQGPLWHLPNKISLLNFAPQSIRVRQSFEAGYYGGSYHVELLDNIVNENGLNKSSVRIKANSSWGQTTIDEYIANGYTFEIKKSPTTLYTDLNNDGNFIAPSDLINYEECGVKRNTDANEELKRLEIPFDYSKPVSLIMYICKMASYCSKNAIILDFFSGSATTAHAVMQLNAEDGGNRKFIMVQLPEKTDEKSEAFKAGYKNICEIGKERIRRAGERVISEQQRVVSDEWLVISKEEKQKYGCKELSRAECLAKINGGDQTNLFDSQKTTERGNICAVGSDATSCNINTVEHCGGTSTQLNEGVSAISGNSQRLESGVGDSTTAMRESGIPCRYGYFGSDADVAGGEQDAKCPFKGTAKCPLTTNHLSLITHH